MIGVKAMVINRIYADNAATTKMDREAFERMKEFLLEEYANPSANYSFSRKAHKAISDARLTIANSINARKDEIYFTSGGTEGDNWIIKGVAMMHRNSGKIITTKIEHHAVLETCAWLESKGYTVEYLPVDERGLVDTEDLEKAISNDTVLVSIMLANNEIGTIQRIKELVDISHKHGIVFHTDAVQAVGHIPVDVKELGVDFLTASAHKFNGCKGVGFAYIAEKVEIDALLTGGAQEKNKRAGTENVGGIVAMAIALENNCKKLDDYKKHVENLVNVLIEEMDASGVCYLRNGAKDSLPGLVNLSFRNIEGEMLLHRLDLKGICISTGAACNSKETVVSHVLKSIKVPEEFIEGTIRISFGKDNTVEEAKVIAKAIIDIVEKKNGEGLNGII